MVINFFDKLVNKRFVDDQEKCGIFLISSMVSALLLKVVSDKLVRAFNRYWATQAAALDIFKASDSVYHVGLLHNRL